MSNVSSEALDSGTDIPSERAARSSSSVSSLSLPEDWNYETTVETIEAIIERIETGEMELADIFDQFAIAVSHLQKCESFLEHHRQQVDVLIETLVD
ncbi:MAG: exodeoxyribonuclease VII small subunit [Leptolyngbyaceae bacterium]|nr:exodeoxyribonuclease VII small subunit [Leptolyngbyaceae bacterium]